MKCSPQTHFKFLAAATTAVSDSASAVMSSRPTSYRGGRGRGQRSYSDRPYNNNNEGRGQFVSVDSHCGTIRDSNLGYRRGNGGRNSQPYHQNQNSHQGGRGRWQRSFSDNPYNNNNNNNNGGRGQFVCGDSHFGTIRDSNLGHGRGNGGGNPQPYNQNQNYRQVAPPNYHQNEQYGQVAPPQLYQNQQFNGNRQFCQVSPQAFYPNQQFRPPHGSQRPPQLHPQSFDRNQQARLQARPQDQRQKPSDYRDWEFAKTTPPTNGERFIVLSYNILADYLAFDHWNKLYFHIPGYMMEWRWRKQNILFELKLWSADIMCFQEVDKFEDLEQELKNRGYSGLWKMRTGIPVDGCATFWRTSRFRLLYEESIEFNKLGLRDNVAQICVLELLSQNNAESATPATSTGSSNRVVICNIHVLYNPKRGDIKLGQVRNLLDRASSISKTWNNAPVVLCGDFNCTPKSPLYNFISEQKLSLSGLDRDKVSGQASAQSRFPSANISIPGPSLVDTKTAGREVAVNLHDSPSDVRKPSNSNGTVDNNLLVNTCSLTVDSIHGKSDEVLHTGAEKDVHCDTVVRENGSISSCKKNSSDFADKDVISVDQENVEICESTPTVTSGPEDITLDYREKEAATLHENEISSLDEPSGYFYNEKEEPTDGIDVSVESSSMDLDKRMEKLSLEGVNEFKAEEGNVVEDDNAFVFALHDDGNVFPTKSLRNESLDDLSPAPDNAVNMETTYNPSSWTPMEIATATGDAGCTSLEHPLKLKSTYTEVEGRSGTRQSSGEPLVTSYNRCFMGTVDYIWRSEGLQTVRVLAPIPKDAMQWTSGFPTKKWGSDHVSLVSELAFTNDLQNQNTEVQ